MVAACWDPDEVDRRATDKFKLIKAAKIVRHRAASHARDRIDDGSPGGNRHVAAVRGRRQYQWHKEHQDR